MTAILEARPSKVHGTGAFALVPIKCGYIVHDWSTNKIYTQGELPIPYTQDEYLQVGPDQYIGPKEGPPEAADLINHSCDPNTTIMVALPMIVVLATRDIQVGEEITFDYSAAMAGDPREMKCNCGSAKCRGTIRERR